MFKILNLFNLLLKLIIFINYLSNYIKLLKKYNLFFFYNYKKKINYTFLIIKKFKKYIKYFKHYLKSNISKNYYIYIIKKFIWEFKFEFYNKYINLDLLNKINTNLNKLIFINFNNKKIKINIIFNLFISFIYNYIFNKILLKKNNLYYKFSYIFFIKNINKKINKKKKNYFSCNIFSLFFFNSFIYFLLIFFFIYWLNNIYINLIYLNKLFLLNFLKKNNKINIYIKNFNIINNLNLNIDNFLEKDYYFSNLKYNKYYLMYNKLNSYKI